MTSLLTIEDVIEHESRPPWNILVRKDLRTETEDLRRTGQTEALDQETDVIGIPSTRGEHLHS